MNRTIALFGALGAAARYVISLAVPSDAFPMATLIVNIAGCFVLQLIFTWVRERSGLPEHIVTGMSTGLIGAFTTFSTFSCDNAALFLSGQMGLLAMNAGVSLIGGLAEALFGLWIGERLCGKGERAE